MKLSKRSLAVTTLIWALSLCGTTTASASESNSAPQKSQSSTSAKDQSASPTAFIRPATTRTVVNKSRENKMSHSAKSISSCTIGTTGGSCTISKGKSSARTVQVSLGISRKDVTSALGISNAKTVTVQVSCTSPTMKKGQTWRAYAKGYKWNYKIKRVSINYLGQISRTTSGWKHTFNPSPSDIYCQ